MNRHLPRLAGLVPLVLAASLVACATGATPPVASQAPGATPASAAPTGAQPAAGASGAPTAPAVTGTKPAATPPPAVQAEIRKALTRVARPIPDPAAGKTFKASQYWDYELGTPFEIEDTTLTGLGDADKDGRVETKIVSDVKLPNGKLQAKLMLLGKYALTQADEDEEAEEEEATGDDEAAGTDDEAAETDGDATGEEGEAGDGDAEDDPGAEAGDDETVDEDFDFADWEDEIDLAEVDEAIDEESDDITWEDDWVVDADGDGEWDETDDADYAEDYTEEEEDTFLTAPHQCEMVVHDAPGMSNLDDLVTVTDQDTGETLTITYDQEWVHFTIKTSAGTGEIEYLPDGSYLVDGQPAADEGDVAAILEDSAWFQVTSRYALSLVAARLGRLEAVAFRGPPQTASYRVLDGEAKSDERRSFAIVNALVSAIEE